MERITEEELTYLLAEHARWLESLGRSGKKLELIEKDLSGVTFVGKNLCEAVLVECDLSDSDLTGVDLYGAFLSGSSFRNAILTSALLNKAEIPYTDFSGADLRHASLLRIQTWHKTNFTRANLEGAQLLKAFWHDSTFEAASLRGCRLDRLALDNVNLVDADLCSAQLIGQTLCDSATVRVDGAIRQLEGEALLKWLQAAILEPF